MTEHARIALLGTFEVAVGGRIVTVESFERRIGAELVQLLALTPHRRLHREMVLDALWPDVPIDSSSKRLHKAASYARKALGSRDAIALRGDVVELFPHTDVTIDVDDVNAADLDDPAEVNAAITLCRGELLPELPYADWLIESREQQARRRLELLGRAGRWREVIELDRANESAYLALMSEAIDAGDRRTALRLFGELERALDDKLAVTPSRAALELQRQADQTQQLAPTATLRTGNALGIPSEPIIGRTTEINDLALLLRSERLVTIVGAGGAGKTHLSRHVAARLHGDFPSEIWMCEFGNVRDSDGAEQQLLSAVGGQRHADATVAESIIRSLGERCALLILDNCEHLSSTVGALCQSILDGCPHASLLATSRAPLGLRTERVYVLTELSRQSAIELFRARARQHGGVVDRDDPTVDRICAHLDDLPLAVELAAARTRSLDLDEIEGLLGDRFEYLRSADEPALEHHQTLRAAIAWSVDALEPQLLQTLVDLSAFANMFDLEAARAVVGGQRAAPVIVDSVDELVRRSLLQLSRDSAGKIRYRLLESVRLFVSELATDQSAADRHLDHFLTRSESLEERSTEHPDEAFRALRDEWDDIRLAQAHAAATRRTESAARILAACTFYAIVTLRFELLSWAEALFADGSESPRTSAEARAFAGWSCLVGFRSEHAEAQRLANAALTVRPDDDLVIYASALSIVTGGDTKAGLDKFREITADSTLRSDILRATSLVQIVILSATEGIDTESARHELEVLAIRHRDDTYQGTWLLGLGCGLIHADPVAAQTAIDKAITLFDRLQFEMASIVARSVQAIIAASVRQPRDAVESIRDALSWAGDRGMWISSLNDLTTAAIVLERLERFDVAVALLSAREHSDFSTGYGTSREAPRDRMRIAHPESFDQWWERGRQLDPRSATAYAVAVLDEILAEAAPPTA